MWREYIATSNVGEVLEILAERGPKARVIAGGTDLVLEIEQDLRPGIDTLIDISRMSGCKQISMDENGNIHLGALVTHNQCVASELIVERAFPLAQSAWEIGAPQIRNLGTVAGNLITASPANDTIPPLMALGAELTLRSRSGERVVPLSDFYTGVRKTVMKSDELLVDICFPSLNTKTQKGGFLKLGLREAQAIAVVNVAIVLTMNGDKVEKASIALGSVAPTVFNATKSEHFLHGQELDGETIDSAADLAAQASNPIDDIRGTAAYRKQMVKVLTARLLTQLAKGEERTTYPEHPILLRGGKPIEAFPTMDELVAHKEADEIQTQINGKNFAITGANHKSLLRLLREDLLLMGTKEGCAEGECGACTVILDGEAVMSCLVPAPRAHGAEIHTIEGVADGDQLHPVQESFVKHGAVQCGYCTPGFIMSSVSLIEESPDATTEEIKRAISGNLCRCTGYHKIIQAIEKVEQGSAG